MNPISIISISIHSPRVGRDAFFLDDVTALRIFQSTLPVWGETVIHCDLVNVLQISIHSPRVGRDKRPVLRTCQRKRFQSTLPVWGETPFRGRTIPKPSDFNPLSPCGERLPPLFSPARIRYFNPLSPCGERLFSFAIFIRSSEFQSTLPVWGETQVVQIIVICRCISIHSPRVGRDPIV